MSERTYHAAVYQNDLGELTATAIPSGDGKWNPPTLDSNAFESTRILALREATHLVEEADLSLDDVPPPNDDREHLLLFGEIHIGLSHLPDDTTVERSEVWDESDWHTQFRGKKYEPDAG